MKIMFPVTTKNLSKENDCQKKRKASPLATARDYREGLLDGEERGILSAEGMGVGEEEPLRLEVPLLFQDFVRLFPPQHQL